jgi:N6-L-threonylcarbamoyladenine synthase
MTLAIETSCDDTSVAIVEKGVRDGNTVARLHFHQKVTSNNHAFQGVHPLWTLRSHQENLADLVADALQHLPTHQGVRILPDFVSVTRGPGMRSNLMCGLDTAKGLAVAWQVATTSLVSCSTAFTNCSRNRSSASITCRPTL